MRATRSSRTTAAAATLDLERDGKTVKVTLVTRRVKDAPAPTAATLADAENVFRVHAFRRDDGQDDRVSEEGDVAHDHAVP